MEATKLKQLFQKYLENRLTDPELEELQEAIADERLSPVLAVLIREALDADADQTDQLLPLFHADGLEERVWQRIARQAPAPVTTVFPRRHLYWLSAAAILLVIGIGYLFFLQPQSTGRGAGTAVQLAPIPEGHQHATLILPDGREIPLRTTESTLFLDGYGMHYGDCQYIFEENTTLHSHATYALRTPAGGQYNVVLSDGSHIRLNTATTLRFPPHFRNRTRRVEIEGEAHFAVNRQVLFAPAPFVARAAGQDVNVLGTEFSISAYPDEQEVTTTLYEGSVRVQADRGGVLLLEPGEQATLDQQGQLRKQPVDMGRSRTWQTGYIDVSGKPFRQVMREIARWYGLEVIYEGTVHHDGYRGQIPLTTNLSIVREFLEDHTLSVRLDGNRLILKQK